jgi:MoxR-like ATPase
VPRPFLVMATQNPIEQEGTYPLPEAQVDRFMLKVVVGYPTPDEELTIAQRSLATPPDLTQVLKLQQLDALQQATADVYVDPVVARYAVQLATATRDLASAGLPEWAPYVAFGASPRGPISMLHAARALALLRGRSYVLPQDVLEIAPDALRHRLVLSYQALAEDVTTDMVIQPVLDSVLMPRLDLARQAVA